ncbi:MAG TPA: DUF5317 family protein [Anaerolineae bacterium]|nr:DUF5317 family protein [Anaerolineae bacterium]
MILLLAFALAVAWGLVRGGSFAHFKSLPLQGYWLAIVAFGLQVIVVYSPLPVTLDASARVSLLFVSYLILAGFVWWNRRLPGMWIIGLGLLSNWLVILANGGYMPITYEALVAAGRTNLVASTATGTLVFGSKDILLPLSETRLWFLSDIFVIPPPFPIPSIFSIGDGFIAFGMFRLVAFALGVPAQVPVKSESA